MTGPNLSAETDRAPQRLRSADAARRPEVSLSTLALPIGLAAIWVFFSVAVDDFLTPRNLSMLAIELSVTATLAVGMLLIILPGHIDLAAGSGVGFLGGLAAMLVFHHGCPAGAALAISLVAGVAIWGAMGVAITRLKVQSFIITLGGLLILRGSFWFLISSSATPVSRGGETNLYSALTTSYLSPGASLAFAAVAVALGGGLALRRRRSLARSGYPTEPLESAVLKGLVAAQALFLLVLVCNLYRGLPAPLLVLGALCAVAHFVTSETVLGRRLYAIGGNAAAARACGVPVERAVITAFATMGAFVAITGFLQTSYAGAATTTVGELMELDAIAACVIGGASLRGGRGSVVSTLAGALVIASLLNGLTLMAVAPEVKLIVRGAVLVGAVTMDVRLRGGS
ncbi:hypothetical protein [Botrimarina sp.]|uniref:sugar ABC transporter permease n=1 Tax=Botrimarina sp. TaxID=2795802 RepID=UPI0032EC209C